MTFFLQMMQTGHLSKMENFSNSPTKNKKRGSINVFFGVKKNVFISQGIRPFTFRLINKTGRLG